MKTFFSVFFSISIAVAQSSDSTDRNIPKGYRIFYVNDSVDYLVIGKAGNQLYGSPRNDGSAVAMMADLNYLRNNGVELTWIFDRTISYERAVELCEKNRQGELGVLLFFTPEPRLKEIYFNFRGFGGQVPLTLEEVDQISRYISSNIGAWYEDPDRMFERQVQLQYYIEWPWEIRTIRLVNYKKGKFRIGPNW